ncbi:MaoC/PaaZ C-terminal domain-containing protein [Phytohabitans sp. ZYX-F-186]|uniref:MaoC/PaaZ C-terminal domain-containing protein n=1 Tax=Phytohabitans maris TaxID=3071409 RepID=A0ABU0ZQQ7_9ACTN|nr:MaoC/PaaZ C-terminal domain-containing protein [Phytohabitans sp. ZYX-F-186]MDQ7909358.1 MaoC/PaaZ C-terminal domain-containing protein [Phytohabitans sp. ZYX-F-186]
MNRDARVGETFTTGFRRAGFAEWNRFAAVNDEFVPIHMDDAEGRAAGYPGAIGMGRLQWSYVHNLLRDWLAGDGRIVSVALRFTGPQLKDVEFAPFGRVTAIRGEEADLDVWIEDAEGATLASGTATVTLPGRG